MAFNELNWYLLLVSDIIVRLGVSSFLGSTVAARTGW
jgi:hypothetical protein